MFIPCELVILTLALTLNGRVHSGEIIGGHKVAPHSRPYMVLLNQHNADGSTGHCGGFLLNEDFVMTAAHCKARSYTAWLGAHSIHRQSEMQIITVEKSYPNKDYNETDHSDDIMLLKLSSKAEFNEHVKPIELASQSDDAPKSCFVSGWGKTEKSNGYMSHVLMEVNVTLIDEMKCRKKNVYCSEGATGPGEGDSGGPLVCENGKAYGVVSSSSNSTGIPIYAFAKIPDKRSWIYLTMKHFGTIA